MDVLVCVVIRRRKGSREDMSRVDGMSDDERYDEGIDSDRSGKRMKRWARYMTLIIDG